MINTKRVNRKDLIITFTICFTIAMDPVDIPHFHILLA